MTSTIDGLPQGLFTLSYLPSQTSERRVVDSMKWENVHEVDFVTSCTSNRSPGNYAVNFMVGGGQGGPVPRIGRGLGPVPGIEDGMARRAPVKEVDAADPEIPSLQEVEAKRMALKPKNLEDRDLKTGIRKQLLKTRLIGIRETGMRDTSHLKMAIIHPPIQAVAEV